MKLDPRETSRLPVAHKALREKHLQRLRLFDGCLIDPGILRNMRQTLSWSKSPHSEKGGNLLEFAPNEWHDCLSH
jgi:hypothetical protein